MSHCGNAGNIPESAEPADGHHKCRNHYCFSGNAGNCLGPAGRPLVHARQQTVTVIASVRENLAQDSRQTISVMLRECGWLVAVDIENSDQFVSVIENRKNDL